MTPRAVSHRRPNPWVFPLAGGLVAGAFDIVYACAYWSIKAGAPPRRILQAVAAGLLGKASFEGGNATAALGLALHFFNAVTMAVVYFLAARRWPLLWQRPWLCGATYGALLFVVMNYVVVPLSAATPGATDASWLVLSIAVHVLLVGIPCALFARLALAPRTAAVRTGAIV